LTQVFDKLLAATYFFAGLNTTKVKEDPAYSGFFVLRFDFLDT